MILMEIEEINELAVKILPDLAQENSFVASSFGWQKECRETFFHTNYSLCLPTQDLNYQIVEDNDQIALILGVSCRELQDIIATLITKESNTNPFTFLTSSALICKPGNRKLKLNEVATLEDCQLQLQKALREFLSNCEGSIKHLCRPANLLKAFRKPSNIFYTNDLLIREIALLIFLGKFEEALQVTQLFPGGISKMKVSPQDVLNIRDHIYGLMNASDRATDH